MPQTASEAPASSAATSKKRKRSERASDATTAHSLIAKPDGNDESATSHQQAAGSAERPSKKGLFIHSFPLVPAVPRIHI